MKPKSKQQLIAWLLLAFLAFVWGSSFILMKRGKFAPDESVVFSAGQVAALRMLIAFLVLLPAVIKYRKELVGPSWKYILVVGLFGNTIPAFLFTAAQSETNSSFVSMLNVLTPLFTLMLAVFVFGTKVKWINTIGVIVALLGAAVLIWSNDAGNSSGSLTEAFLVIGATLCYAISVNTIKRYLGHLNPILITACAFAYVAPAMITYLFIMDSPLPVLQAHPHAWQSLGYIAILAIVGTAIAVILFNRLVSQTTPVFAASVTYLIPIVGIFWGWLDGESIAPIALVCSGIILAGLYLVNKK